MKLRIVRFSIFMCLSFLCFAASAKSVWILSKNSGAVQGVSILVHGLNNKPSKMEELAAGLNSHNQDVLLVTLAGHDGDVQAFKQVSRQQWIEQLRSAYRKAQERAQSLDLPLHLVGYSVGGLLGVDMITSGPESFSKMILFAPAIAVHSRSRVVKLAGIFGKAFMIPSMAPREYRAHRATSVAAYEALFESQARVSDVRSAVPNVPTLIFVDPKDELVSIRGLYDFINSRSLYRWSLVSVNNNQSVLTPQYHHLIIDSASAGRLQWLEIQRKIKDFL